MKGYLERMVETYIFERRKEMESAFFAEIQKIGTENGIETKIILNESKIVDALKNCQEGYQAIKAEVAREILAEIRTIFYEIKYFDELGYASFEIGLEELEKKYTEEN